MFFSKKTMPRDLKCIGRSPDVIIGGIAKRAVGLPSGERRKLLRQLRSADPEQAENARMTLDGVYLQLLSAVAGYVADQYQWRTDCTSQSRDELIDKLIEAGRKGVLQEMCEPKCRRGERFALRVVKAAQQAMKGLIEEKKTNDQCAN